MPPVDDLIKLLIVCSVIVLPALGITARFALKPIVEAILRLREGGMLPGDTSAAIGADVRQVRAELQLMREDMAQVRAEMGRLQEVESFHAALAGSPAAPAALPRPETLAPNS